MLDRWRRMPTPWVRAAVRPSQWGPSPPGLPTRDSASSRSGCSISASAPRALAEIVASIFTSPTAVGIVDRTNSAAETRPARPGPGVARRNFVAMGNYLSGRPPSRRWRRRSGRGPRAGRAAPACRRGRPMPAAARRPAVRSAPGRDREVYSLVDLRRRHEAGRRESAPIFGLFRPLRTTSTFVCRTRNCLRRTRERRRPGAARPPRRMKETRDDASVGDGSSR
jgi:hypothetical protein